MAASNKKNDATLEYEAALKATAEALKAVVAKDQLALYLSSKNLDFCQIISDDEMPKLQENLDKHLPENIKVNLEDGTWEFTAVSYSGFYQMHIDNFIDTNKQLFK